MAQTDLTLQLHHGGAWHDAATLSLLDPDAGFAGPTRVAYTPEYFVTFGAEPLLEGVPLTDSRALSVCCPVSLEDRRYDTWPPFLLDILPQGYARLRIAEFLRLDPHARSTDLPLLRRAGAAPVGNVRVKEAFEEAVPRLRNQPRIGVEMTEIEGRHDRFLDVADRFAFIASGSSGLQGEWPKLALTQARDGLWYPDPMVDDEDAQAHIIVKLVKGRDQSDRLILEAEADYAAVAKAFGLRVQGNTTYHDGVLIIPRFDRRVTMSGVTRFGQESMVSAIEAAKFGHLDSHERYLAVLREHSVNPLEDVTEYVLRDVLNLAMGNPDNHGRNTALAKTADGTVRLSPLFDFAPMRLATDTVVRSTKWQCMKARGRDHDPDWAEVCRTAAGDTLPAETIMMALAEKEDFLRELPDIARQHGIRPEVVKRACARHLDIAERIAELCPILSRGKGTPGGNV